MKRLAIFVLLASALASATTYTVGVSTGCTGANATLANCANHNAVAGDTVIVPSTYAVHQVETIAVNAITIEGDGGTDNVDAISVASHSNITIGAPGAGLTICATYTGTSSCISVASSSHITIQNNTIGGTITGGGGGGGCIAAGSSSPGSYITIQNNVIQWCGPMGDGTSQFPDTTHHQGATGAIKLIGTYWNVNGNTIRHVGDYIEPAYGQYNVVQNNIFGDLTTDVVYSTDFGCNPGNGASNSNPLNCTGVPGGVPGKGNPGHVDGVQNTCTNTTLPFQYWLIQNNTMAHISIDAGASGLGNHLVLAQTGGTGCTASNVIARYNVERNNEKGTYTIAFTPSAELVLANGPGSDPYIVEYNNTVATNGNVNNYGSSFAVSPTNSRSKNSIYYNSTSATSNPWGIALDSTVGPSFIGTNDLFYTLGATFVSSTMCNPTSSSCTNFVLNSDPLLNSDGTLQSSSPARQAGDAFTTVASGDTGAGTDLIVNDCSYFPDPSWGGGITADVLRIGTTNTATVSSVNYSTCHITLTGSVSRSVGDKVYVYSETGNQVLFNTNPDIGALPYIPPVSPSTLTLHCAGIGASSSGGVTSGDGNIQFTCNNGLVSGGCTHGTLTATGDGCYSASYANNATISTISGTAAVGSSLSNLTGSAPGVGGSVSCNLVAGTCSVNTGNADVDVTFTFSPIPQCTVTLSQNSINLGQTVNYTVSCSNTTSWAIYDPLGVLNVQGTGTGGTGVLPYTVQGIYPAQGFGSGGPSNIPTAPLNISTPQGGGPVGR